MNATATRRQRRRPIALLVRAFRRVVKVVLPPVDPLYWPLVPFSPLLFTATFIGAIVVGVSGNHGIPMEFAQRYNHGGISYLWLCMALTAAPLWLSSVHMIGRGSGRIRYYGFWIRMVADLIEALTLTTYDYMRVTLGGYQIVLLFISYAATLFCCGLLTRDVHILVATEQLAGKIRRTGTIEARDAESRNAS